MPKFEPKDPDFEAKVRDSFGKQTAMQSLGAVIGRVKPGSVEIEMPYRADFTQQHGFVHGGIVTAIVDSACGYAALSLSVRETQVLTVEYKVNFVAPARGDRLLARGEVVRSGSTITVCKGDVFAYEGKDEKLVASMLTTMMLMPNRSDLSG